jgi:hypothetical protein
MNGSGHEDWRDPWRGKTTAPGNILGCQVQFRRGLPPPLRAARDFPRPERPPRRHGGASAAVPLPRCVFG